MQVSPCEGSSGTVIPLAGPGTGVWLNASVDVAWGFSRSLSAMQIMDRFRDGDGHPGTYLQLQRAVLCAQSDVLQHSDVISQAIPVASVALLQRASAQMEHDPMELDDTLSLISECFFDTGNFKVQSLLPARILLGVHNPKHDRVTHEQKAASDRRLGHFCNATQTNSSWDRTNTNLMFHLQETTMKHTKSRFCGAGFRCWLASGDISTTRKYRKTTALIHSGQLSYLMARFVIPVPDTVCLE